MGSYFREQSFVIDQRGTGYVPLEPGTRRLQTGRSTANNFEPYFQAAAAPLPLVARAVTPPPSCRGFVGVAIPPPPEYPDTNRPSLLYSPPRAPETSPEYLHK